MYLMVDLSEFDFPPRIIYEQFLFQFIKTDGILFSYYFPTQKMKLKYGFYI